MTPKDIILNQMPDAGLCFLPDIYDHSLIGVTVEGLTVYNADEVLAIIKRKQDCCKGHMIDMFENLVEDYIEDCVFIYIPYVA